MKPVNSQVQTSSLERRFLVADLTTKRVWDQAIDQVSGPILIQIVLLQDPILRQVLQDPIQVWSLLRQAEQDQNLRKLRGRR